ncbi:hypothetical protein GTW43_06950 [Streptomyces sp. SID5785]|uniref:hypothetical protein n=1 Tax=Streptomyces sp. SID5785 TaxID=2690309 RepID=UPI001360FA3A|nr:hypothetical protein [Streptomyces sp. SID5785]MZD04820.1 hypothetical protein [Streptomyces sp. SID5785]
MRRPKGKDPIYFDHCTSCSYILCLGDEHAMAVRTAELSMPFHYEEMHRTSRPEWTIDVRLRREVDPHF